MNISTFGKRKKISAFISKPKVMSQHFIKNLNNRYVSNILNCPYIYFRQVDKQRKLRSANISLIEQKIKNATDFNIANISKHKKQHSAVRIVYVKSK